MTNAIQAVWLAIHRAVHNPNSPGVVIDGLMHSIQITSAAQCRSLYWRDQLFCEQNRNKTSKYAEMARHGDQITWVIRDDQAWGLIINEKIVKE